MIYRLGVSSVLLALLVQAPPAISSELCLPSPSAAPGTSVVLPAEFLPETDSISGIQFDVQYDSSATTLAATLGDAATDAGKSLYCINLSPNTRRFLVVGPNQNVISPGALVNFAVNLNPNAAKGVCPLILSDIEATDPFGNPVPISDSCGTVTVQGTNDVAPSLTGVLNGASLLPGPVAPGEVVTLISSGIGAIPAAIPNSAGSSVAVDGTPVHVLYAGSGQINLVIPDDVSGKTTAQLQVANAGGMIASLPLSIVPTAPGVFTRDGIGFGPGAILNDDSTVNSWSNPASRSSVVRVLATGAGQMGPPVADRFVAGDILPQPSALPVSVQVGGLDSEVLGVRTLPELMAGVLDVTFRVPAEVAPGSSVPVVLKVGEVSSQAGVTLAVR